MRGHSGPGRALDGPHRTSWLRRAGQRCRSLHDDQGGQSIVYLVIMIFPLACITFMVINSGALIHDKIQVQSAADAAVLSGTTWMVRAMNLNSMLNIFMSMLLAEEILMKATYWTAMTALVLAPFIELFWMQVCLTTAMCTPAFDVVVDTFELWPVAMEAAESDEFLWDVMETLSDVEEGVHTTMSGVAQLEAVRVAVLDGAAFGLMYPTTPPEEQGELEDLCDATADGSAGGYLEEEYAFLGGMAQALASVSGFQRAGDIRNLTALSVLPNMGNSGPLWGDLQIPYHQFWASTAPYHFTNVMFSMAVTAGYGAMCGGSLGIPSLPYAIPASPWCFFCPDAEIVIPNPYHQWGPLFWNLNSNHQDVEPYVLAEDWDPNFWAFAYKSPADVQAHFIPDHFQNPYGDNLGMLTVSQAQIYNPHEDGGLFSPHWRTHLAPIDVDDSTLEAVATTLLSGAMIAEGTEGSASGLLDLVSDLTGIEVGDIIAH